MSKLFVGNLNFAVSEGVLEAFIREFGIEVEKVDIIRDAYTGKSRGFGFVQLPQGQDVSEVISVLNGKSLEGRQLNVNEAFERNRSSRGGGHGGGGQRRGRGPSY
ncbi:MAG: RNA-binding protein [Acidobacteria bacterium]|nr:RNA-binding protein [Acidobacteriota bacterium]